MFAHHPPIDKNYISFIIDANSAIRIKDFRMSFMSILKSMTNYNLIFKIVSAMRLFLMSSTMSMTALLLKVLGVNGCVPFLLFLRLVHDE